MNKLIPLIVLSCLLPLAVNARETTGGLFLANPCPMSDEECAGIFREAYR